MSALIVSNHNLNKDCSLATKSSYGFMSILESQQEIVPKIFVGEEYLFGEEFNYSKFLEFSLENKFIERYISYIDEVINLMKFQVYFLNEDPELFEQCLFEIHEFKESYQSGKYLVPFVAWKGICKNCPLGFYDPNEPTEYDNMDVWAITILDFRGFGIETTYFVNAETIEQLPFF